MAFEPIKKLKVAEQVAGIIREAIVGGSYRKGDSLPSERELATQFGVNRSSIREALMRLEAWGLVDIKQGGATRVRDVFYSAGLQILPYLVAPNGRLDGELVGDILAVRAMLMAWTARLAAEHATDDDVAQLEEVLQRLDAATELSDIQRIDFEFFEGLVATSHNKVLSLFTNALRDIYRENASHLRFLYSARPFDLAPHRQAVEAIAAGDGDRAAAAMKAYGERAMAVL